MNTETGQVYEGEQMIREARERGEPVREMTPEEIREYKTRERDRAMRRDPLYGYGARKSREGSKPKFRRAKVKAKRKAARASRKANRR